MNNPPSQRYYKIAWKSAEQQTFHTLAQPVSKETTQLETIYGCLFNEACDCYDDLIIAWEQLDEACEQKKGATEAVAATTEEQPKPQP